MNFNIPGLRGSISSVVKGRISGLKTTPLVVFQQSFRLNRMSRFYEHRHIVSFQETNLVGNVYYTNHVSWQGRVRELFLRDHVPDLLSEIARGLSLATVRISCEYLAELFAFDEILIRMRLKELTPSRIEFSFEYWRVSSKGEEMVARGEQQVACLQRQGTSQVPIPVPTTLRRALEPYLERL